MTDETAKGGARRLIANVRRVQLQTLVFQGTVPEDIVDQLALDQTDAILRALEAEGITVGKFEAVGGSKCNQIGCYASGHNGTLYRRSDAPTRHTLNPVTPKHGVSSYEKET